MADNQNASKKQSRLSQADMPSTPLKDALALVYALRDNFASDSATPIDLAMAVERSPSSSAWRTLTGAAVAYGLTTGAYNASNIGLSPLGKKIAQPLEDGEDTIAIAEAALKPSILAKFYNKYDGNRLPDKQIAKNQLNAMGVPHDRTENSYDVAIGNAEYLGFVTVSGGNKYLQLRQAANKLEQENPQQDEATDEYASDESDSKPAPETGKPEPVRPKPIFIAHGKDQAPLEQLTKILDQFKIPYKVAVTEPHAGRPISQKVRDLMSECGSAIFIFSTNGEHKDASDEFVANLNVVFELGAASVLYGEKVIIFKESGLTLPSDFNDLGYISFESQSLDAKAMDLLKELISMGFVQVVTAG